MLPGEMYMSNQRWAACGANATPDNLIATSWHNNIYAPLATFGGFDVFVVKQGPVRDGEGNIALEEASCNQWWIRRAGARDC